MSGNISFGHFPAPGISATQTRAQLCCQPLASEQAVNSAESTREHGRRRFASLSLSPHHALVDVGF